MMDDRYRSRKYTLAVFFAMTNTTALFTGFLDDAQYVMSQAIILGLYGAANVLKDKK